MMHTSRCSACRFCGAFSPQFPAGTCNSNGIILKLKPEVREWVNLKGCATFQPCALIDAETNEAACKMAGALDAMKKTPFGDVQ